MRSSCGKALSVTPPPYWATVLLLASLTCTPSQSSSCQLTWNFWELLSTSMSRTFCSMLLGYFRFVRWMEAWDKARTCV